MRAAAFLIVLAVGTAGGSASASDGASAQRVSLQAHCLAAVALPGAVYELRDFKRCMTNFGQSPYPLPRVTYHFAGSERF